MGTSKNNSLQGRTVTLLELLHRRIFGEEISDVMREFLKNLSFSFFGGVVAAAIMFGVNIMAGRVLGPLGYGTYNYLLSLAAASVIFFILGNSTGAIRFLSDENYRERKGRFLSAAVGITVMQGSIFSLIALLMVEYLELKLGLGRPFLVLVFIFTLVLALKEMFDSFLRSFLKIKEQAFFRVVDALLVFGLFIYLFSEHSPITPEKYVYAVIFGAVLFSICSIFLLRKEFAPFSLLEVKELLNYNRHLLLAAFGGFLLSFDKIIIGNLIGAESLGIFSAYYASSQLIVSNLGLIFMNAFWPFVIKNKDNLGVILSKIDLLFMKFLPPVVVLNALSITLFITLYGEAYPVRLDLILLFALASIANIVFFVYISLLNIDHVARSAIISLLINILLIGTLAISRNIPTYLAMQIVLYPFSILLIRRKIMYHL